MPEGGADGTYRSSNQKKHTANNWFYRKHLEAFYETLYEMVSETEGESLLDAGCGEGFVVAHLAARNPNLKITGIDVNAEAIEYARAQFGETARFRTGSVYKLPFSDKSFDIVLCSEVLEHVDDPNRAIVELKRVARKHVVITVPLEPYFQWLNNLGRALGLATDPEHVNFWTKNTFQAFIRAHFDRPNFVWKQLYQLASAPVGAVSSP